MIILRALVTLGMLVPATAAAQLHGFYTDEPSYRPGDTIRIHASSPEPATAIFVLVHHGDTWREVARTGVTSLGSKTTRLGSFVEVDPAVDLLGGRTAFTLEGWFLPTMVGGDAVLVAGQGGASQASAGIVVLPDGRPAGYLSSTLPVDETRLVTGPAVLSLDTWHHLALRYDGQRVSHHVDGVDVARRSQTGAVAANPQPFRLGARAEAPGDLTGVADGRLDSWALWPRALSAAELAARRQAGLDQANPAPDPGAVELFVSFEDAYGTLTDGSIRKHALRLVNHGTPRVTGDHRDGAALRIHHDQIVDAGWPAAATLAIPDDAPSGLYSVQARIGPTFQDQRVQALTRAFAVRPRTPTPGTRIAVVLPTNTWTAYNDWPGDWQHKGAIPGITSRPRTPGAAVRHGGNNSAYGVMGDGISPGHFPGWRRPNANASVNGTGPGGQGHKGPQSLFLVQFLASAGLPYDVYADLDLDLGRFPVDGGYRVLVPHGHHEYWSQPMLEAVQELQRRGGSIVSVGGNVLTYRVSQAPGGVMEIRKWPGIAQLGEADGRNAIDGERAGSWSAISICRDGGLGHLVTGSLNHLVGGCDAGCYGRWEVTNERHWLWGGEVSDQEHLGRSPVEGIWSIGHEADTYVPGLVPPGLAAGTTPEILAEGVGFGDLAAMRIAFAYPLPPGPPAPLPTCADVTAPSPAPRPKATAATRAGSIVLFRHQGGGHVLSIGAVSAAWSLVGDPKLARLTERALRCFGLGEGAGCPADPVPPTAPPGGGGGGCSAGPVGGLCGLLAAAGLLRRRRRRPARRSA